MGMNTFSNSKMICSLLGFFMFAIICINTINVMKYTSTRGLLFNEEKHNKDDLLLLSIADNSTQQSPLENMNNNNTKPTSVDGILTQENVSVMGTSSVPIGVEVPPVAPTKNATTNTSSTPFPHEASSNKTVRDDSNQKDNNSIPNFQRYEGVVIVTKVLKGEDTSKVSRMLCFLQHGYNDRTQYDIVIFTTMPWRKEEIAKVQKVVAPAKLTVAVEGPPLEEQIAAMTTEEKEFLYKRCGIGEDQNITWYNYCTEEGSNNLSNLGYAWQAEFRSYHIWNHDAIKGYKYMMWFDSE